MEKSLRVPLLDLKGQYQAIRSEVMAAIEAVCDQQGFILGPRVGQLEEAVAKYVGSPHAVGVASGSDALMLSLMGSGVGQGDEVVTVPFTFFATTGAISRLGARPVFVDIRPDTFNMDPSQLERCITTRTKAIIPVHLFGQCAEMGPIMDIAGRKGLRVIEDAAQAIGASQHGRNAGTMGDTGCFSFFPSKNLGGFGDGGMVTTENRELRDTLAMLRVHGSRVKYVHEAVGINSRLDALQAAVLLVKLHYLDQWTEGRRRNAERYERLFAEAKVLDHIVLPKTGSGNKHVFNQYTIRARKRDELREYLKEHGVGTEIYYPAPLHLQQCYRSLGYREGSFPVSEQASQEVLSIPIYAELTDAQITYVADSVADYYGGH